LGSGATVRSKTRIGALAGSARNKGIVTSRVFRIDPTSTDETATGTAQRNPEQGGVLKEGARPANDAFEA